MNEFEIIDQFLALKVKNRKDVIQGTGDDCALLKVPRGQRLAVSMDTLIGDVHFLSNGNPAHIAHKAIAVNLSDLAASGAEPAWITLSLTLPETDQSWLSSFHQGLKKVSDYFGVQIIGGDLCKGPLSITIQAHGFVPESAFCHRSTAKAGELICVTGTLGNAALGLLIAQKKLTIADSPERDFLLKKYETPFPRLASGIALRNRATAGIDISDGLLADIHHLSQASQVGALLQWEAIPLSNEAKKVADHALLMRSALLGGDDYELCFTVKEDDLKSTEQALEMVGANCTTIGRLSGKAGVRLFQDKKEVNIHALFGESLGYQHF
jgi:thiamine-monophosphate kinase